MVPNFHRTFNAVFLCKNITDMRKHRNFEFYLLFRLDLNIESINNVGKTLFKQICEFWLQMNGTGFLILDCLPLKFFKLKRFIGVVSITSVSSLNILAF